MNPMKERAMKAKRILIIEDDKYILRGLEDNLSIEGYQIEKTIDGRQGLHMALHNPPDLILLDIMLPGMNGYDICREVKGRNPAQAIIMLTAKGQEVDKVVGLNLGADDYVTKPFGVPELLARIRAVLRRATPDQTIPDTFSFGSVYLDFKKFESTVNGEPIHLSAREFHILKYMISRKGEVVHRHDLLDEVWGYEHYPSTRTVDTHILELRKKLEPEPSNPKHIISIRGIGYKFLA